MIGRLPECTSSSTEQGVSRRHAVIRKDGDGFVLVDLNSRNFTFLNHRQIPPDQPHPLKQSDRITICDVEFVFYLSPPEITEAARRNRRLRRTRGVHPPHPRRLRVRRSATRVRPEIKLKAIIEISRNLSSNLKLDAVAPKLLETLLDIFPQAERSFLVLLKDGSDKIAIRKSYHKARPARAQPRAARPPSANRPATNHA